METFSVSLALCEGNTPVTGGFISQRTVMLSFDNDVFYEVLLNKRDFVFAEASRLIVCLIVSPILCKFTWKPQRIMSILFKCIM